MIKVNVGKFSTCTLRSLNCPPVHLNEIEIPEETCSQYIFTPLENNSFLKYWVFSGSQLLTGAFIIMMIVYYIAYLILNISCYYQLTSSDICLQSPVIKSDNMNYFTLVTDFQKMKYLKSEDFGLRSFLSNHMCMSNLAV